MALDFRDLVSFWLMKVFWATRKASALFHSPGKPNSPFNRNKDGKAIELMIWPKLSCD